jgi:hypothetical protein
VPFLLICKQQILKGIQEFINLTKVVLLTLLVQGTIAGAFCGPGMSWVSANQSWLAATCTV